MSQESRTTLKTYFQTNDFPTEAEFIDLIDSMPNFVSDSILVGGEDNIVAFNGGGQANATQLTKRHNRVSTQTNPNDSVKLPNAIAGQSCSVFNDSGGAIDVFPFLGGFIEDKAVNLAGVIGDEDTAEFFCYTNGKWSDVWSIFL